MALEDTELSDLEDVPTVPTAGDILYLVRGGQSHKVGWEALLNGFGARPLKTITSDYTLLDLDAGQRIMAGASLTITLPDNMPTGYEVKITNTGEWIVEFEADTTLSNGDRGNRIAFYGTVTAFHEGLDVWRVEGDVSHPLDYWVIRATDAALDISWAAVIWAEELSLFVAVGGTSIMTSPDGITWTARTGPASSSWTSLCYAPALGLLVAVGTGATNRVMTSPDGITWTAQTSTANATWRDVCWSESQGLLVAVGDGLNKVMTSPDGVTWTVRTAAASNSWLAVVWAEELGLFVSTASSGTNNRAMTSPDGITWTIRATTASNSWGKLVYSPTLELLVAVSSGGTNNRIMTSPDGINWTVRLPAMDIVFGCIVWSAKLGLFIAGSNGNTTFAGLARFNTSEDGINWKRWPGPESDQGWAGLAWSESLGRLVAVHNSGNGQRVTTGVR